MSGLLRQVIRSCRSGFNPTSTSESGDRLRFEMRLTLGLVLACFLSTTSLPAQRISGTITSRSGAGVPGAFVVLVDSVNTEVDRALTTHSSTYSLRAPQPGMYSIRILRIGFRIFQSEPLLLSAAERVFDTVVDVDRVPLPAINIQTETRCDIHPEEGTVTAILWDQIREALEATYWTMRQRIYRFNTEIVSHTVRLGRMIDFFSETTAALSSWPFLGADPGDIRENGFVRETPVGLVYVAPGPRTLFSQEFLATHCLRVRRDGELIGLGFEPSLDRNVPDVQGTLWVDSTSLMLETLDFEYVNLPRWIPDGVALGTAEFRRLPNGAWVMQYWRLEAPIKHEISARQGFFGIPDGVFGIRVRTGRIVEITDAEGNTLYRAESD